MGIFQWLAEGGFEFLQTTSIVAGLFATAHGIRAETRERKIQNLLALNGAHRELWSSFIDRPELHRIHAAGIDLDQAPVTEAERRFVHLLILHLRVAFKVRRVGMEFGDDALAADIRQFFARPIPRAVWKRSREFQDAEFVAFVESALADAADGR